MRYSTFPVIDPIATGRNIADIRKEKGLTVKDLQKYFGFEEPQAIYRWQYGKTLPSVDNLYALSSILGVPMEKILVPVACENNISEKQQEVPAASAINIVNYALRKKLASTRLTSFSVFAFPMTRITSASSSLSQRAASCAFISSSRYLSRERRP